MNKIKKALKSEAAGYVYSILFFVTLANIVVTVGDFFAIGTYFGYTATCDQTERFGYVWGKGWSCTKNYNNMVECFEQWKIDTNQPKDCRLARRFPMRIYYVHRWWHYIFNKKWHHPYRELKPKPEEKAKKSRKKSKK